MISNSEKPNKRTRPEKTVRFGLSGNYLSFVEGLRQPFAIFQLIDDQIVTLALSAGFCELYGCEDLTQAYHEMDRGLFADVHPDDADRLADSVRRFAAEGGRLEVIYRLRKKNSTTYTVVHLYGDHVYTENGARLAHVWYADEGEYHERTGYGLNRALYKALHEESMQKAARYDSLTGLPNMTWFFALVEAEEHAIEERGERPVLLYMDLSRMKNYNHKFGFSEGNRLLCSFADILSRFFGGENCCHIAADHFAVLTKEDGLEETLHRFFMEWDTAEGGSVPPVHVGIYPSRMEGLPASGACDRAKIACDALRGTFISDYHYYSQELEESFVKQQYILDHFDRALSEKWIQVWYQPIMRAGSRMVCHNEALARWHDPEKSILYPVDFIPWLEDAGLLYKLDLYVLERVLEDMKTQKQEGLCLVPHSVNLSRSDFDACDMVEEIRQRVDASGISRDRICIEITESTIGSDFDFMKTQVEGFQKLGFPVWMDDFGSGYSSLDVLQSIRFDLIKFDMNFMRKLDESRDGRIILTQLMKMAAALGLDTVCEGVETEDQADFLWGIGCSKLQGYYFGRPTSFKDMLNWHRKHKTDGYENPEESAYGISFSYTEEIMP